MSLNYFLSTVSWEMFIVGASEPQKLNAQIFVYNKQFVCLIIVDCHNPQNILTKNFTHKKIQNENFPNYDISAITIFVAWEAIPSKALTKDYSKHHTTMHTERPLCVVLNSTKDRTSKQQRGKAFQLHSAHEASLKLGRICVIR